MLSVLLNPIGILNISVGGFVWSQLKELGKSEKFKNSFAAINKYLDSDQGKRIPLIFCDFPVRKENGKVFVADDHKKTRTNVETWLIKLDRRNSFKFENTYTIRLSPHHNNLRLYVEEIHTFYEVYPNGEKQFCVDLKFVIGPHDVVKGMYEIKKFVHHEKVLERRLSKRKREFQKKNPGNLSSGTSENKQKGRSN